MTYLEHAAAILNKALTEWNQRAIKNPDDMRAEILDARLRIADGFARLAAVERTEIPADASARISRALRYCEGGLPDGEHHKTWVIDQMVRALTGCPMVTRSATDAYGKPYSFEGQGESEEYLRFVNELDGWDEGIAP